jgi:hypothetical protein
MEACWMKVNIFWGLHDISDVSEPIPNGCIAAAECPLQFWANIGILVCGVPFWEMTFQQISWN